MTSVEELISTIAANPDGLAGKSLGRSKWQSKEMNLSNARKLELSLKRQKGGDGFYRMIGLSRLGS